MDMPAGVVDVVLDCGAVGDGLHDDTAAIQRALDVPGAVVLLPKGFLSWDAKYGGSVKYNTIKYTFYVLNYVCYL